MRVLILNQYYPPDSSNTARLLEDFAQDLAAAHDVKVIAGRPSYNAADALPDDGRVRVRRVRSLSFSRGSVPGRVMNYASYLAFSFVAAARSGRPDVVLAQTDPPIIGLVAALVAQRFGCRFVFVCHDVHPDIAVAMGMISNRPLIALWRAVNRFIRRRADTVVVVGRDMREKLARDGVPACKLVYVPTWAPDEASDPVASALLREELGWADRFVVMHAGNIGLAQNVGILADAAEHLRDHRAILIVLVGDGASRPALERDVARRGLRNVEILSYRPRDEAHALMAAADVHVVSLVPGLWGCAAPSKTYAAMAMARPFVAAVDSGSEPAIIAEQCGCGVVVAAGDGAALADALIAMRSAPRDEIGAKGRRAFESQFSASSCIARLRAVVEATDPPLR
jgi:glycosyltransferase involved in cell wall biosynthesis